MIKDDLYKWLAEDFKLQESDILSIYLYGSRVYGTDSSESDYDFIVVVNNGCVEQDSVNSTDYNFNAAIYQFDSFQDLINRHKNFALDCYFLPSEFRLKDDAKFTFTLDLNKLRKEVSAKSSNSFVKCKKKFEVEKDRNVYVAKKSLFHSLRIIDFGIQIAEHGKITNYGSSNNLWVEIKNNPAETWEPYKAKYQEVYNNKMTSFRKLAPLVGDAK